MVATKLACLYTVLYTVQHRITKEIVRDDYILAFALETILELNTRDQCNDWIFFDPKARQYLDIS